jgi:hypothetical protein
VTWTKRKIIASLIMAAFGAIIGGYYAGVTTMITFDNAVYSYGLVPIGGVIGFLTCFLVSIWYLKFMQNRSWKAGLFFGPLFGALAGMTSGVVTLIGINYLHNWLATSLLSSLVVGGVVGAITGVIIGFLSAAILGARLLKSITETR